jgi:hypothetical protein
MKLSDVKTIRKKTFSKEKKCCCDLGGHARCKDSITIKKVQDFVRVGEGVEFTVLTYICF